MHESADYFDDNFSQPFLNFLFVENKLLNYDRLEITNQCFDRQSWSILNLRLVGMEKNISRQFWPILMLCGKCGWCVKSGSRFPIKGVVKFYFQNIRGLYNSHFCFLYFRDLWNRAILGLWAWPPTQGQRWLAGAPLLIHSYTDSLSQGKSTEKALHCKNIFAHFLPKYSILFFSRKFSV